MILRQRPFFALFDAGKVSVLVDKVGDLDDQWRALRSFAPPPHDCLISPPFE